MKLLLALKPHFLCALAMFMLIAWMAVEESRVTRGLLIAPITLLFLGIVIFYGLEYDAFVQANGRGKS